MFVPIAEFENKVGSSSWKRCGISSLESALISCFCHLLRLAGAGLDLGGGALGALLADDAASAALAGRGLGLLRLLGGGSLGLLLLALLDSGLAGGSTGLGPHGPLLLDDIEGSTNDGTLGLDGATSALLGGLLSDTLAVLSAEKDGPRNAAGVLALEEEGLGLSALEAEDLAVATDEQLALISGKKSVSMLNRWNVL